MSDGGAIPPLEPGEPQTPEIPQAAPSPEASRRAVVAEDLDTPWDILDLVILFVFSLGMLYLLSSVMATIAMVRYGIPRAGIDEFVKTNAGFVILRQVLWFGLILLFLAAVIRRRTARPFWRTIGWRPPRTGKMSMAGLVMALLFGGMVLAVGADVAMQFYKTPKELPIEKLFTSRRNVEYIMLFGLLVAPLAEETVFRGYVYPVLARKFGILSGIVFTGILFGMVHVPQLLGGWGQIVTLVVVGMALTTARAVTRSVVASYLVHLGYNGFLFAGMFLPEFVVRHL